MKDFDGLPDDGRWFIRWVDRFGPSLGDTSTISITLFLARLPDEIKVETLSQDEVATLFAAELPTQEVFPLVGSLPMFTIGQIYEAGKLVGRLPTRRLVVPDALANAEDSAQLGRENAPTTLDAQMPFPADMRVNPAVGVSALRLSSELRRSCRVLVAKDHDRQMDLIIPRSLIFRTFYAFRRQLALSFTHGPWTERKKELLYLDGEFKGHRTAIGEDGSWNVVLQKGMRLSDAPLMALLHFDTYASQQANSLYQQARAQSQSTDYGNRHWYARATLPFRPDAGPYAATLSGYPLNQSKFKGTYLPFLVSTIHEFTFPRHVPEIGRILRNDANDGEYVEVTQASSGYKDNERPPGVRPASMRNDAEVHASQEMESFVELEDTFNFTQLPCLIELTKDKSKRYLGARGVQAKPATDGGSTGPRDSRIGSLSGIDPEVVQRDVSHRFEELFVLFESLVRRGVIASVHEVHPPHKSMLVKREARMCWNFLSDYERNSGKMERRGWHVIQTKTGRVPRSAMVLSIELTASVGGYWIEIETRPGEGILSPLLLSKPIFAATNLISDALRTIAQAKGTSLRRAFGTDKNVLCYTHTYQDKGSSALNRKSVERFLESAKLLGH
ncbi:hypothetical protein [Xanthomonas vasicola]|uniref:hypothetical protein n=1 Tax=Xanthomonas vasicola TaxID=56459 RepID=UPI000345A7B8|nr:hypothetical protein [Xanthomonas vasicola]KFA35144.1 hypothetical protein KWI_0114210 [Xanthomonas vasicola pv. vasculorum NCPPB 206]MDO6953231.1 hypothetical protein [Xanthomonas vasicola]